MSAPTTRVEYPGGVVLEMEHDPRGFLGTDECLCGHPEEKHVYSTRTNTRCCVRCACCNHQPKNRAVPSAPPVVPPLPERQRPIFGEGSGKR